MPVSRVTFWLTEEAFLSACHQLWRHRANGRGGNRIAAGVVAAAGCFVLWAGVSVAWGWAMVIGAAGLLALDQFRDLIWRRHYRRLLKYPGPITAIFDEAGVGVRSGEGENHVPWSRFAHYVITADYLFLLLNRRRFSVIPRKAFATSEEQAVVEGLVARHLPVLSRRLL